MKAEQLRKSILQLAIQGKLVPQDPNDEPASVLLERIHAEKQRLIKEGKIKKDKNDSVIFKGDDNRYYEKVGSEVKDITDDLPFEIPDSWGLVRLSMICWLGDTGKSSGERLPYLDAKTLRGKTDKNILIEGKIVDIGTKVILVDGENSGEVFDVPFRGYMGSTFKILETVSHFNLDYLNLVLDYYRDTFRGNKIGAAIPHLNKNLFRSLLVGFPPLPEQARIVAEIEKFEPLITEYDKLEQQATKLDDEIYDKLKKSILKYAIQGKLVPQDPNDEPASVLLERIRAEKKAKLGKKYVDSYIYKGDDNCYYEHIAGRAQDELVEVPFDIPYGWSWCRLAIFAQVLGGKRIPAGRQLTNENTGHYYIKVSDMKENTVCLDKLQFVPTDIYPTISRYIINKEDVYITVAGTIGRVGTIPNELDGANLTENADRIVIDEIDQHWLVKCLLSDVIQEQIKEATTKVGQPKLAIARIEKFLIPLPPLAEQKRIVAKINEIFAML